MSDTQEPTTQQTYIGEILAFSGDFAPPGWAFCEGQALPVRQYGALFSLVGTMYGGDGRVSFHLPDCRTLPASLAEGMGAQAAGETFHYCICLEGIYPTPEQF